MGEFLDSLSEGWEYLTDREGGEARKREEDSYQRFVSFMEDSRYGPDKMDQDLFNRHFSYDDPQNFDKFLNRYNAHKQEMQKRFDDARSSNYTGGRIGYALGGNEMLRDSRQGLGSMMMAGDETEPPMEMIDPGFDSGPEELLQDIDREGMLRTAAMEDPMLGLVIQAYDELKDQGQLPNEYLGPQGLENFIKLEGERIIQSMQQRDEGAGIASLRA